MTAALYYYADEYNNWNGNIFLDIEFKSRIIYYIYSKRWTIK